MTPQRKKSTAFDYAPKPRHESTFICNALPRQDVSGSVELALRGKRFDTSTAIPRVPLVIAPESAEYSSDWHQVTSAVWIVFVTSSLNFSSVGIPKRMSCVSKSENAEFEFYFKKLNFIFLKKQMGGPYQTNKHKA